MPLTGLTREFFETQVRVGKVGRQEVAWHEIKHACARHLPLRDLLRVIAICTMFSLSYIDYEGGPLNDDAAS